MNSSTPALERQTGRTGLALTTLLAMLFMYQADTTIVNVAAPAIRIGLHASGAEIQLAIGTYLVASAAGLITGARLGHLVGYRRMFIAGVVVFGLASLACGLAPTAAALILARVAQGIGGAMAFPQVLTGLQLLYPDPGQRTRAFGRYALALATGAVSGQVLGGLLVTADVLDLGWRPVFLVNVPISVAVVALGVAVLPRQRSEGGAVRLDVPGALLLGGAMLALLLPLTLGPEVGWRPWTWASLGVSLVLGAGFIARERFKERRDDSPLVSLRLVTTPAFAWGLVSQGLVTATYSALLFTLAAYLQQGQGRSALFSGLVLVPWVAAFGIPGRLMPLVPERWRPIVPAAGCLVMTVAFGVLGVTLLAGVDSVALLVVLLGLGGFGLGTGFASMLAHLTTVAPAEHAADISGLFSTTLQILGAIGVATVGTVYLALTATAPTAGSTHAFGVTSLLSAGIALTGALAAYRATRCRPR